MAELDRNAPTGVPSDREREEETAPVTMDGDRELVRWTLSLSLDDRLAVLQEFVLTFWTPRHG